MSDEPLISDETFEALLEVADRGRAMDECTIVRKTGGSSSGGAPTRGSTGNTTLPCQFRARTGGEVSGDALKQLGHYELNLAPDADIRGDDTVLYKGRTFRVVWTPPPTETERLVGLEDA